MAGVIAKDITHFNQNLVMRMRIPAAAPRSSVAVNTEDAVFQKALLVGLEQLAIRIVHAGNSYWVYLGGSPSLVKP